MKEDYASIIKKLLTAEEVCRFYGIEVSNGKARCPFHNDRSPSMYVYPYSKGWYCFVCNEGGSVIDLVMRLFNLSFKDAMIKLNDDFNIGLPIRGEQKTTRDYTALAAAEAMLRRDRAERQRETENARGDWVRAWDEFMKTLDQKRDASDPVAIAQAEEDMKRKAFLLTMEEIKRAERREYASRHS